MTVSISHSISNAVLDTGAFNSVFDLCFLQIYSGTIPTNTDPALPDTEAALSGNTLLRTYTVSDDGSTGLGWAAAAVENVLAKDAAEAWSGTAVATGTASFFRMTLTGDSGGATPGDLRIQGNVGLTQADLLLPTLAVVSGVSHTVDNFSMALVPLA